MYISWVLVCKIGLADFEVYHYYCGFDVDMHLVKKLNTLRGNTRRKRLHQRYERRKSYGLHKT